MPEGRGEFNIKWLAERLWKARSSAAIVPRRKVMIPGHELALNQCHANVTAWVNSYPSHKALRGWLVFDLEVASLFTGEPPHFDLLAHSIVANEAGEMFDITPVYDDGAGTYPFLPHPGELDEFERFVGGCNLARIRLRTREDPMQVACFET